MRYPAVLTKNGPKILVTFIDIPEAITFGRNKSDALKHAVDALQTALSFYLEAQLPLPKASRLKRGQKLICAWKSRINFHPKYY